MQASPTKLRSGEWGAKVQSDQVTIGETITITTRGGKSWDATITKVIWTGDGVSIVATENRNSRRQTAPVSHFGRKFECDECGEFVIRGTRCWETGAKH